MLQCKPCQGRILRIADHTLPYGRVIYDYLEEFLRSFEPGVWRGDTERLGDLIERCPLGVAHLNAAKAEKAAFALPLPRPSGSR